MSAEAQPWANLSHEQRRKRVKALALKGKSHGEIARLLRCPSRNAICGLIFRLRESGDLPSLPPTKQRGKEKPRKAAYVPPAKPISAADSRKPGALSGLSGGVMTQLTAKARAQQFAQPVIISRAAAFDPVDGIDPITLMDLGPTTCRWPVDRDAVDTEQFFCGAPCDFDQTYCDCHAALSRGRAPMARIRVPAGA